MTQLSQAMLFSVFQLQQCETFLQTMDDDEYFYLRFRFRKEHLVHFMMLIGLYDHDKEEYKKFALDAERHYCYADTSVLIFLA